MKSQTSGNRTMWEPSNEVPESQGDDTSTGIGCLIQALLQADTLDQPSGDEDDKRSVKCDSESEV